MDVSLSEVVVSPSAYNAGSTADRKVPPEAAMAVVERFASAFNRQDVAALAACFTADATYHDGFYGEHRGGAALRAMFERMFREGKDYVWRMDTIVETPVRAAAEWTFSYVVTDALPRSAGRRVRFCGMSLVEIVDGRISAYREYFDVGQACLQLGFTAEAIQKVLRRKLDASRV
jgi:steroid delta-isomerase-like uncharacterized protein